MTSAAVIHRVVTSLEHVGVTYMMAGSFVSSYFGAPRTTADIDFVVAATPEQIQKFLALLPPSDYYFDVDTAIDAARRRDMFNVLDNVTGWKIDLIFQKQTPFGREELARRVPGMIEGVQVFVATPEDVIIAKLGWAKMGGSRRQIEDVAGVLRVRGKAIDRSYIERWVKNLDLGSKWKDACREAGIE